MSDFEISKEPRWKNNIRRARQHLIKMGCLATKDIRGVWEITEKGKQVFSQWSDSIKQDLSERKIKLSNDHCLSSFYSVYLQ